MSARRCDRGPVTACEFRARAQSAAASRPSSLPVRARPAGCPRTPRAGTGSVADAREPLRVAPCTRRHGVDPAPARPRSMAVPPRAQGAPRSRSARPPADATAHPALCPTVRRVVRRRRRARPAWRPSSRASGASIPRARPPTRRPLLVSSPSPVAPRFPLRQQRVGRASVRRSRCCPNNAIEATASRTCSAWSATGTKRASRTTSRYSRNASSKSQIRHACR